MKEAVTSSDSGKTSAPTTPSSTEIPTSAELSSKFVKVSFGEAAIGISSKSPLGWTLFQGV
jgi:hypothetical protein